MDLEETEFDVIFNNKAERIKNSDAVTAYVNENLPAMAAPTIISYNGSGQRVRTFESCCLNGELRVAKILQHFDSDSAPTVNPIPVKNSSGSFIPLASKNAEPARTKKTL